MRLAAEHELAKYAIPVIVARASESDLASWFPVPLERIDHPEAVREPTVGALVRLESGHVFVVYYGHNSRELTIRIPRSEKPSEFMRQFFREVPLPPSRVLWHRRGVRIPEAGRDIEPVTNRVDPDDLVVVLPLRRDDARLGNAIREFVVSATAASNIVVIKTAIAAAQPVASALDVQRIEGVLGSIGGDDTIIVITSTVDVAAALALFINSLLGSSDLEIPTPSVTKSAG